jgi:cyclase
MKKKRIIPVVLFKEGQVVQSKFFSEYRNLGNPFDSIRRLSEWGADEVCFIDIGTRSGVDLLRRDLGRESSNDYLEILSTVSTITRMPLSSGGHVRSLEDIEIRLSRGADKVLINSYAFQDHKFLAKAINTFGSQCIAVSIDVKYLNGDYAIYIENGITIIEESLTEAVKRFNEFEVGEIFLNSIDRDGSKKGFDLELIQIVASLATVPLVVCGGVGSWEDLEQALNIEGVDAVAAANIFQHIDQSLYLAHKYLYDKGLNVRRPQLLR